MRAFYDGQRVYHRGTDCCGYRKGDVFHVTEFKSQANGGNLSECTCTSCGIVRILDERYVLDIDRADGVQAIALEEWLSPIDDDFCGSTFSEIMENLSQESVNAS